MLHRPPSSITCRMRRSGILRKPESSCHSAQKTRARIKPNLHGIWAGGHAFCCASAPNRIAPSGICLFHFGCGREAAGWRRLAAEAAAALRAAASAGRAERRLRLRRRRRRPVEAGERAAAAQSHCTTRRERRRVIIARERAQRHNLSPVATS
jgi:hypothetical protein